MCLPAGIRWMCGHQWQGQVTCHKSLETGKKCDNSQDGPAIPLEVFCTNRLLPYYSYDFTNSFPAVQWCCSPACCIAAVQIAEWSCLRNGKQEDREPETTLYRRLRNLQDNYLTECECHYGELKCTGRFFDGFGIMKEHTKQKTAHLKATPHWSMPTINKNCLPPDADISAIESEVAKLADVRTNQPPGDALFKTPVNQYRALRDFLMLNPRFIMNKESGASPAPDQVQKQLKELQLGPLPHVQVAQHSPAPPPANDMNHESPFPPQLHSMKPTPNHQSNPTERLLQSSQIMSRIPVQNPQQAPQGHQPLYQNPQNMTFAVTSPNTLSHAQPNPRHLATPADSNITPASYRMRLLHQQVHQLLSKCFSIPEWSSLSSEQRIATISDRIILLRGLKSEHDTYRQAINVPSLVPNGYTQQDIEALSRSLKQLGEWMTASLMALLAWLPLASKEVQERVAAETGVDVRQGQKQGWW